MKNCPFCGSFNTKVAAEASSEKGKHHVVFVECLEENCKARGPIASGTGEFVSNDETALAFNKWNKRF